MAAGRYNPALVAIHNRKRYALDAGYNDDLAFWSDGRYILFVLSYNSMMPYIGLQRFVDYDECGSVFKQESEVDDFFGIKDALENRSPAWLFKQLLTVLD